MTMKMSRSSHHEDLEALARVVNARYESPDHDVLHDPFQRLFGPVPSAASPPRGHRESSAGSRTPSSCGLDDVAAAVGVSPKLFDLGSLEASDLGSEDGVMP
jgi:hypothetical protein